MPKVEVFKNAPDVKMHNPVSNEIFRYDHVFFKRQQSSFDVIHIYGLYGVKSGGPSYSDNPATSVWCTAPPATTGPAGYDRKPLSQCYGGTRAKNEIAEHIIKYGVKNKFFKAGTVAAPLPEVIDIANDPANPTSLTQFSQWLQQTEKERGTQALPIFVVKVLPIPANNWPLAFKGMRLIPKDYKYAYCFHAMIPIAAFQKQMSGDCTIPKTVTSDSAEIQKKEVEKAMDADKKAKSPKPPAQGTKAEPGTVATTEGQPDITEDSSTTRGSGETLRYVSTYKIDNIPLYVDIVAKVLQRVDTKMKEYGITFPTRPLNLGVQIKNLEYFKDNIKSQLAKVASPVDPKKRVILAFDKKFKLTAVQYEDKKHPEVRVLAAHAPYFSQTANALIYHLIHIYKKYQTTYGSAEWNAPEVEIRAFLKKYIFPTPLILNTAAGEYIAEKYLLGDKRLLNEKFWDKYKQFPMSANVKMQMKNFAGDSYKMIGDALGFKYASGGFQQIDDFDDFYEQCLEWIDLSKIIQVAAVCMMKAIGADEWIDKICKEVVDEFEKHRDAIIGWCESQDDPATKAFAKELKDLMFAGENWMLKQTESMLVQGAKKLAEMAVTAADRETWASTTSLRNYLQNLSREANALQEELSEAPLHKEPSGLVDKIANLKDQLEDMKEAVAKQKQRQTDLGTALPANETNLYGQLLDEKNRISTKIGKLQGAQRLRQEQFTIYNLLLDEILPELTVLNPYLSETTKGSSTDKTEIYDWFESARNATPSKLKETAAASLNEATLRTRLDAIAIDVAGGTVVGGVSSKLYFNVASTYVDIYQDYHLFAASTDGKDKNNAQMIEDTFDSLLVKVGLLLKIIHEKGAQTGSFGSLLKEGAFKGGKAALLEMFDKDQRKRAMLCAAIFATVGAAIYGIYYLIDNWDEVSVAMTGDMKKLAGAIEKRFALFMRTDYPVMDILESLKEAAKQIGLNLLKDLVVNTIMWLVDVMQAACAEEELVAAPYSPFGQVSLGDFMVASKTNNNLTSGEGVMERTKSFTALSTQTNISLETFNIILSTLSAGLSIREVCSLLEETAPGGTYNRAIQILQTIPQLQNTSFYDYYVNMDGIKTFFELISKDIKPQYCILAKQAFEREKELLLNICVDPADDVLAANLADYLSSEDVLEALANRKKSNLDRAGDAAKFLGQILDGPEEIDPMCGGGANSMSPRHESQQYAANQAGDAIFAAIEKVFEDEIRRIKYIYRDDAALMNAWAAQQTAEGGDTPSNMKLFSDAILGAPAQSKAAGDAAMAEFESIAGIATAADVDFVANKIRTQIRGLNTRNAFVVKYAQVDAADDFDTTIKTKTEIAELIKGWAWAAIHPQDMAQNPEMFFVMLEYGDVDAWRGVWYEDKGNPFASDQEFWKSFGYPDGQPELPDESDDSEAYLDLQKILQVVGTATIIPAFSFDLGTDVSLDWGAYHPQLFAGLDRMIRFRYKPTAPGKPNVSLQVYIPSTGEILASYKTRKVGLPFNFYMLYQEQNGWNDKAAWLNNVFLYQFAWPNNTYNILINSIFEDLLRYSGDNGLYTRENFSALHLNKYSPWSTLTNGEPNPEKCFLGFFNKNVLNNQTQKMIDALACFNPDSVSKNSTTVSFIKMLVDCLIRVIVVKETMKTLFTFGIFNKSQLYVKDIEGEDEEVPFFQVYFKKEIERALLKQFGVIASQLFNPRQGLGYSGKVGKAVKVDKEEEGAGDPDAIFADPCSMEPALETANFQAAATELQKFNDEIIAEWVTGVTRVLFQNEQLTDAEAISININQQIAYVQEVLYRGIPDNVKGEQLSGTLAAYQQAAAKASKNTFLENFDPHTGGSETWVAEASNLIKLEKLNAKAKLLTIENDALESFFNPAPVLASKGETETMRAERLWFPYDRLMLSPATIYMEWQLVEQREAKASLWRYINTSAQSYWTAKYSGVDELVEWIEQDQSVVGAHTNPDRNTWTKLATWAYGGANELGRGGDFTTGRSPTAVLWAGFLTAPISEGFTIPGAHSAVIDESTLTTVQSQESMLQLATLYPGVDLGAEVLQGLPKIEGGKGGSYFKFDVPMPPIIERSGEIEFISHGVNSGLATDPYVELNYVKKFYDNLGTNGLHPDMAEKNRQAFKDSLYGMTRCFAGTAWSELVQPLSKFLYETKLILLFPQMHDFLLPENFDLVKTYYESHIFWHFFQHNFIGGVERASDIKVYGGTIDSKYIMQNYAAIGSALTYQGKIYLSDWLLLTGKFEPPTRRDSDLSGFNKGWHSGFALWDGGLAPQGADYYGKLGKDARAPINPVVFDEFMTNGILAPEVKDAIPHHPSNALDPAISWGNYLYNGLEATWENTVGAGKTVTETGATYQDLTPVWHRLVDGTFKCGPATNARVSEQDLYTDNFFGWLYSLELAEIVDIEFGYNITQYTFAGTAVTKQAKNAAQNAPDLPHAEKIFDDIIENYWKGSDYTARWDIINTLIKEKVGKVKVGSNNFYYIAFPIFNVAKKAPGRLRFLDYIYQSKFDDAATQTQWIFTWPGETPVTPAEIGVNVPLEGALSQAGDGVPVARSHYNFGKWAPQPIRVRNGALSQNPRKTRPVNPKNLDWIGLQKTPIGKCVGFVHIYRSDSYETPTDAKWIHYTLGPANVAFTPTQLPWLYNDLRAFNLVPDDKDPVDYKNVGGRRRAIYGSNSYYAAQTAVKLANWYEEHTKGQAEAIGEHGILISNEKHLNAACEAVAIPKNYMGTWWEFSDGVSVTEIKEDTVDVLFGSKYNTLYASTIRLANIIGAEEDTDPLFAYGETFFEMMSEDKKVAFERIMKSFFLKEQTTIVSIMHRILSQKYYPAIEYNFDYSTRNITNALMTAIAVAGGDYQYAAPGTETDIPFPLDLSNVDWSELAEMVLKALLGAIASACDPTWQTPWFFPGPFTPIGVAAKILIGKDWWGDDDDGDGRVRKTCEDALTEQTKLLDLGPFFNK